MRGTRKAVLAGTVLALLSGPAAVAAEKSKPARLTDAVHATNGKDEAPGHSYTSPVVAIDPDDPLKVYAATVDVRAQRCALMRSADGGRTWKKAGSSPSPEGFPFCTHDTGFIPMSFLALGRDKTLYYFHLGWDVQDGGRSENRSVFLARSTDEGENWQSTPVNLNRGKTGDNIEKNVPTDLVVDTVSGDQDIVYVGYTASFPNPATPAGGSTRPGQPFIAASVDGGKTFGAPVNVATAFYGDPKNIPTADIPEDKRGKENFGGSSVNLAVDGRGHLLASWNRSTANITPSPPTVLYLSRSTDRGKTFAETTVLQPDHPDQTGPTGAQLLWSAEGGATGSLHAIWEGKLVTTQGDRDVYYRRSVDDGKTWSSVKTLNDDDPKQLYGQFQPTLTVAPDGRLEAAWWDMRDNAGRFVTDVYATTSDDSGASWSPNIRVTDQSIDRNVGVWKPGTGGDVRQPPGLAASDELTVVIWDDTRHASPQTETQDLYAATLQYKALAGGGMSKTLGYALAAVVGVAAVGLLLGLLALAMRGRRAPPPAAPAEEGKRTVEVG